MELEHPSVLDASETVSKAVNEISKTGLPVLVLKDGRYIGLIDERSIRQRAAHPDKEKCETIAERTPTLAPESTVMDACNAFFAGRFKAIPVVSRGKIQGAITRQTLLNELLKEKMLSKKRVSEVMTSPVESVDIKASVGQARGELRRHNIRRLVVTDDGKIAGLISVFDLASFLSSPRQSGRFYRGGEKTTMDGQTVASYMKKQVETIRASESLSSAVEKMLDKRVSALIVSEGGSPVGIVTAKDILHATLAYEQAVRVFVSGLPHENRDYQEEIQREGDKLLARLDKSFEVSSIVFHIKKEGSGFSVRSRLDGKKSIIASASDFHLENAVRQAIAELRRMAEKGKLTRLQRSRQNARMREE